MEHEFYAYTIGDSTFPDFAAAFEEWSAGGFKSGAGPVFRFGQRPPTDAELAAILTAEGYTEGGWYEAGYLLASFRIPRRSMSGASGNDAARFHDGYSTGAAAPAVLRSHNMEWGFWGRWRQAWESQDDPDSPYQGRVCPPAVAWCRHWQALAKAAPEWPAKAMRQRLDNPEGRHRADGLLDRLAAGSPIEKILADAS